MVCAHHHIRGPTDVPERRVAEQGVVAGDHQVGIGRLVEMPAVAVALGLQDADLLEVLQTANPGVRVRVPLADVGAVPKRPFRRIFDFVAPTRNSASR